MLVNVHDAKSQLSKLIVAAEAGDDVVIARKGKPAVPLVPVQPDGFQFDTLAHLVDAVPDFDEAMDEDDLALWEGRACAASCWTRMRGYGASWTRPVSATA